MLPVIAGIAKILSHEVFLCEAAYEVNTPATYAGIKIQRILLTVDDVHIAPLLNAHHLTLVLTDGSRWSLPTPIQEGAARKLVCYRQDLEAMYGPE